MSMDWESYIIQGIELLFLGIASCMDLKDQTLSVRFLKIFGGIGILCNLFFLDQNITEILTGILPGAVVFAAAKFSKEAVGYGDALMILILGIFEGGYGVVPVLFTAFFAAGVYGLFRVVIIHRSVKDTMPFVPFLFLAFMGVKLL